jgi:hypothetical protein
MNKNPIRISRAIFISLSAGVLIGLIVDAFIMDAAWKHNPQQIYYEPGNIHWDIGLP